MRTNSSAALLYNAKGFLELNRYNAYCVNNITAKKNADASVAVQFGGCEGKIPNCLPTMTGWNYMVQLYRPRAEALNRKRCALRRPFRERCPLSQRTAHGNTPGAARELTSVHRRRRVRNGVVAVVRYAGLGLRTIKSSEWLKSASRKCLHWPFC